MPDRYPNFATLAACEDEGADFQVRLHLAASPLAVIAPHGGGIEAGTSELAEAVAGREHSFYAFEETRGHENAASVEARTGHRDIGVGCPVWRFGVGRRAFGGDGAYRPPVFLGARRLRALFLSNHLLPPSSNDRQQCPQSLVHRLGVPENFRDIEPTGN